MPCRARSQPSPRLLRSAATALHHPRTVTTTATTLAIKVIYLEHRGICSMFLAHPHQPRSLRLRPATSGPFAHPDSSQTEVGRHSGPQGHIPRASRYAAHVPRSSPSPAAAPITPGHIRPVPGTTIHDAPNAAATAARRVIYLEHRGMRTAFGVHPHYPRPHLIHSRGP